MEAWSAGEKGSDLRHSLGTEPIGHLSLCIPLPQQNFSNVISGSHCERVTFPTLKKQESRKPPKSSLSNSGQAAMVVHSQ